MDLPAIRDGIDGALLDVRVSPGARRERVVGLHGQALKMAVRSPPEKGRANRELTHLLAGLLGVAPRLVEVTRGARGRDKTVRVRGWSAERLRSRIGEILVTLGDP